MMRSKIVVLAFCCMFSINSFAEMTGPEKYGWVFGAKFVVDGIAAWQQIEQIQALDDIAETLPSDNCQGVCQSNSDEVNKKVINARTALGFGVAFSVLSDVANLVGLISSVNGNEPLKVAMTTFALSGINFIVTFSGNANLWDIKNNHMAGLPEKTEEETDEAIGKGVVPLVITGIVGLPPAVVMCVVAAAR